MKPARPVCGRALRPWNDEHLAASVVTAAASAVARRGLGWRHSDARTPETAWWRRASGIHAGHTATRVRHVREAIKRAAFAGASDLNRISPIICPFAILSGAMCETDEHSSQRIEITRRPTDTPTCDEATALGRKRQSPGLARCDEAGLPFANESQILSGAFEPARYFCD